MANEPLVTELGFDASAAVIAVKQLVQEMDAYNAAMRSAADLTSIYNRAGREFDRVLISISRSGASAARAIAQFNSALQSGQFAAGSGATAQVADQQIRARQEFERLFRTQNQSVGVANAAAAAQRNVVIAATQVGVQSQAASRGVTVLNLSLSSLARIATIQVLHQAISALRTALSQAVDDAIEFELRLAEITTIGEGLFSNIDSAAKEVEALAVAFGRPVFEVAEGVYETLSNQIGNAAEVSLFMRDALNFAQAAATTTNNSVNLLSSVLNAYNLSAAQAADISGKLFRIIDLGRVRADDIANSFGRVTVVAAELGISFDELGGILAGITIQGVKPAEALTQISSIMQSLVKPSADLSRVFQQLGISSAEAGILAAGGLIPFLRQLTEFSGTSTTEISELIKNVRALRGVVAITGQAGDAIDRATEAIRQAGAGTALEAAAKRFQTDAQTLRQAGQEIEVAFLNLGRSAISVLADIVSSVGGGTNALKVLTVAVGAAAVAFTTLRAATIAAGPFGLSLLIGGIAATIAGFTLAIQNSAKASEEAARRALETQRTLDQERINFEVKTRIETNQRNLSSVAAYFQNLQRLYNQDLGSATDIQKQLSAELDSELDLRLNNFQDYFRAVQDRARQAADNIKAAESEIRELGDEEARFRLERALANASAEQQARALIVFSQRLETAGQKNLISNEQELVDLGRQRLRDAIQTAQEALQAAVRAGDVDLIRRAEANVLSILRQQRGAQQELIQLERQRQTAAEAEARSLAQREGELKTLIARAQELATVIERGRVREGLVTEQDIANAKTQFEETIGSINQILSTTGKLDLGKFLDISSFVQQLRREPVGIQGTLTNIDEIVTTLQRQVDSVPLKLRFQLEDIGVRFDTNVLGGFVDVQNQLTEVLKQNTEALNQSTAINQNKNVLTDATTKIRQAFGEVQASVLKADSLIEAGTSRIGASLRVATQAWLGTRDAAEAAAKAEATAIIKGSEAAQQLQQTQANLLKLLAQPQITSNEINSIVAQLNTLQSTLTTDEDRAQLDTIRIQFQQALEAKRTISEIPLISPGQDAAIRALSESVGVLNQQAANTATSFQSIGDIGVPALSSTASAASNVISQMNAIRDSALEAARAISSIQLGGGVAQAANSGRYVHFFSQGGFAPRGRDTVPAMLTPGEFVVNAAATRKFYSQLVAMNKGIAPRYMAQGGPVTNVGDITVNVQGGNTSELTVRKIGEGLRRELRRGTLKLS